MLFADAVHAVTHLYKQGIDLRHLLFGGKGHINKLLGYIANHNVVAL